MVNSKVDIILLNNPFTVRNTVTEERRNQRKLKHQARRKSKIDPRTGRREKSSHQALFGHGIIPANLYDWMINRRQQASPRLAV